ncbi:MAG: PEP-CTERM sorting domain-containing protein [bacterium]
MYDTTASGTVSGTYTATFTFVTRDQQNLSGANTTGNTLVLTAQVVVVPEPATIALAGLGAGLARLRAARRRTSQTRAA